MDIIEAQLVQQLRQRPSEDGVLGKIVDHLTQGGSISSMRASLGFSQRRLHALFDSRIGIRPKLFARLQRFTALLDAMPDRTSWSDLAAAEGFCDQAHLIREFRAFSDSSPVQHSMVEGESRHAELASA